jgi:hypothetical protein
MSARLRRSASSGHAPDTSLDQFSCGDFFASVSQPLTRLHCRPRALSSGVSLRQKPYRFGLVKHLVGQPDELHVPGGGVPYPGSRRSV